jgi:hypothetical protein
MKTILLGLGILLVGVVLTGCIHHADTRVRTDGAVVLWHADRAEVVAMAETLNVRDFRLARDGDGWRLTGRMRGTISR